MSLFCFRCRVSLIFLSTVLLVMLKATACTDRCFVWPVFNLLWKLQREMTSWVCAKACSDCLWLKNSLERNGKWGCCHVDIYVCVWGGGGVWRGWAEKERWLGYLHYHEERERESVTRYNSQGESVNSPIMIKEDEERFCCKSDSCIQYIYIIIIFLS